MIINTKTGMIAAGRVTHDAEFKTVGAKDTHLTKFSIAGTDGTPESPTVFVNVVAWFDLADYAERIRKGDRVLVAGTVKNANYTNKQGELVKRNELVADFIQIQSNNGGYVERVGDGITSPAGMAQFMEIDDDDGELPF